MSFWGELRRRNVVKVGLAYAVVAWLLIQVAATVLPTFGSPEWVVQTVTFILILGFPVALLLAWAFEVTPDGIKKTRQVPLEDSIAHLTGQRLNYFVTGALALAVAFLLIDDYVLERDAPDSATGTSSDSEAAESAAAGPPNSIAVLPFVNISSDPEQEYFADGLSEELMNQLAQIDELLVTARTSSFVFKGQTGNVRAIGAQLGVRNVLEGSVRKAGDRVLITAQLIDTTNGFHLWSDSYNRELDDIFAIQEEISAQVANALSATLGLVNAQSLAGGTDNVEAYDHYLIAQALNRATGFGQVNTLLRRIEELEAAVALDPSFGLAQVALARAYGGLLVSVPGNEDAARRSRDAALARALEIAPDLPETHMLVADQHADAWRWSEAEQALSRALELAPASSAQINRDYGAFLVLVGRAREALGYLEVARRGDPLANGGYHWAALAWDALGNATRAAELYRSYVNLPDVRPGPIHLMHLFRLVGAGETEAALEYLPTMELEPIWNFIGDTLRADSAESASRTLRIHFDDPSYDNFAGMYNIAVLASKYGDVELADAALRRSMESANAVLSSIWTPIARPLRKTPAFKETVRHLGLDTYWRRHGWPEHCRPRGDNDFECD